MNATLRPATLSRFVVETNTKALRTAVTVAATDDEHALELATALFRQSVAGYSVLNAEVTLIPAPGEFEADPNRGMSEADMDSILRMESDDFARV